MTGITKFYISLDEVYPRLHLFRNPTSLASAISLKEHAFASAAYYRTLFALFPNTEFSNQILLIALRAQTSKIAFTLYLYLYIEPAIDEVH